MTKRQIRSCTDYTSMPCSHRDERSRIAILTTLTHLKDADVIAAPQTDCNPDFPSIFVQL
jgi:hypothetical protein